MYQEFKSGDVLAERYRIEDVLGWGATAVVVAATHVEIRAPRAIKLPLPLTEGGEQANDLFLREAVLAARLRSEHVVRIHDGGVLPSGTPYIVMERIDGPDLVSVVQERGRLPPEDAALYVAQACAALAEAHGLGILHLDIKPGNLFLTTRSDGSPCVKVLDFGLACARGEAIGPVPGSYGYMAPELEAAGGEIGPEADVWALGVVLYELLAGRHPFRGTLSLEPRLVPVTEHCPDVPLELAGVVSRCLDPSPSRRFTDAAALRAALAPFAAAPKATLDATLDAAPEAASDAASRRENR